jgi:hypothetical protein
LFIISLQQKLEIREKQFLLGREVVGGDRKGVGRKGGGGGKGE